MKRRGDRMIVRGLVWFHRWLGLVTCLLFALWFASGAVLLFVPFPSLPRAEGLAISEPLDLPAVAVSPARAIALAGPISALRLRGRAGVPVYVADTPAGLAVVDARTGERRGLLAPREAAAIVARNAGAVARVIGPFAYDQWIVHNQFDPLRPFYRVDLGDAAGTQIYVSARTGDIVQRTTRWQRGWNWPGAVLHWAYLTPLRSSFTAWDRTVWAVSLVCLLVAAAGMGLGIWRTVQVRRAGQRQLTWFRLRWMRWHHLGGLFAGVFVLTWIFSGWLSMDHGRLFSRGTASAAQLDAYAGLSLASVAAAFPIDRLRRLPPLREVRFVAIAGEPLAAAVAPSGRAALWTADGERLSVAAANSLTVRGLAAAWPGSPAPPHAPSAVAPDSFYALAEGMPAGAERIDGAGARPPVYVDADDRHVVTVMSGSRAAYAWVYYALHTFNFPGLTRHPWLHDVVVLVPLLAGFLFSLTGVVLGCRRLRRDLTERKIVPHDG